MEPEPGEVVFFHGHSSWRSLAPFYVRGLLIAVIAGAGAGLAGRIADGHVNNGWVIPVVLTVFIAGLTIGQLRRLRTTYSITNRRLIIETGLFARQLHQARLERVQNVSLSQSLPRRMLGVGTVNFDTAAEADFSFSFVGMRDPRRLVSTVDRALRELPGADAHPGFGGR